MKTAIKITRKTLTAKPPVSKKADNRDKKLAVKDMQKIPVANTEQGYNKVMAEVERLMKLGNGKIRNRDLALYSSLAKVAETYEQSIYTIEAPKTLEGLLEWKMYELKLKQKGLAKKLNVSDAKLSLIMSGKQKPDTALLKSIHQELGIDGNVLLNIV